MKIERGNLLDFFRGKYDDARSRAAVETEHMDRSYKQYLGDSSIDGSDEPAKIVRNITYELIESQISSYIPSPKVTPVRYGERGDTLSRAVENLLRRVRDRLPFEEMNDLDERYSPIYGGSVWLIEWDNSIRTNDTVGDVKISCISPKRFFGQPGIKRVEDMEYCFICFDTTREEIIRRYGVDPGVAEDAVDESGENSEDLATLVLCYYLNENNEVCQYVFSGDTEIYAEENYFSRKKRTCRLCGQREGICLCEKPKFVTESDEEMVLDEPIETSFGVIPARSQKIRNGEPVTKTERRQAVNEDGSGAVAISDATGMIVPITEEVIVPVDEPTVLPFYKPKRIPIVIRKNTSAEDRLYGTSDCEVIRPQQQAINKIESRILEKLIKASVTPILPEDATVTTTNQIFGSVIRMKPGENAGQYGRIDTTPDVSMDAAEAERLYDHAKRILGISDAFQGQHDSSAQSGYAKQLQISRAEGRLSSKRKMKNFAYSEIDRVIFEFYLAYADEPRPAVYTDALGVTHTTAFNRFDFYEVGEDGKYRVNDAFLFSADENMDIEQSREALWEQNLNNLKIGTYGDPAAPETLLLYWMNMERAHYPYAHENVTLIRERIAAAKQSSERRAQSLAADLDNRDGYIGMLQEKIAELGGKIQ